MRRGKGLPRVKRGEVVVMEYFGGPLDGERSMGLAPSPGWSVVGHRQWREDGYTRKVGCKYNCDGINFYFVSSEVGEWYKP